MINPSTIIPFSHWIKQIRAVYTTPTIIMGDSNSMPSATATSVTTSNSTSTTINTNTNTNTKTTVADPRLFSEPKSVYFVLGNESCDLDSAVSALSLAYGLTVMQKNIQSYITKYQNSIVNMPSSPSSLNTSMQSPSMFTTPKINTLFKNMNNSIVVPVLNMKQSDFVLKPDIKSLLSSAGIDQNDLLFIDDIELYKDEKRQDKLKGVFLVDHNVLASSQRWLDPFVVGIIDHRPDLQQHLDIYPRIVKLNASATSLIVEFFHSIIQDVSIDKINDDCPLSFTAFEAITSISSLFPLYYHVNEDGGITGNDYDTFINTVIPTITADKQDRSISKILLGPGGLLASTIIIDTLNVSTTADKVRDEDYQALDSLGLGIWKYETPIPSRDTLFDYISTKKRDVTQLLTSDLLRSDMKISHIVRKEHDSITGISTETHSPHVILSSIPLDLKNLVSTRSDTFIKDCFTHIQNVSVNQSEAISHFPIIVLCGISISPVASETMIPSPSPTPSPSSGTATRQLGIYVSDHAKNSSVLGFDLFQAFYSTQKEMFGLVDGIYLKKGDSQVSLLTSSDIESILNTKTLAAGLYIFDQNNIKSSRKQVIPVVNQTLDRWIDKIK